MIQMESPKRKLQKKNDYQRHKLFRKIKRRRKAQVEAEQQIAEKQLRKKLKLPKFDRGEDELSTYKKQVEMFNDANSDPTLPGRLVDRNRVTVNPETGDVMEVGGHVNLDPVIITGKMPDNLKRTINKNIESDRIQDLLYKDRLSPVDPVGELVVESAAIGKPYRFENFLPSDYKWKPSSKDSKDWEEYRATMNQVRHRLLDTEHLINDKYPSGKELEKAIDNRQMDLIMANFDVTNGYGADYYNAYKDLLGKANRTNSYRDWQNVIDFENHIRNSLKYLPDVAPFAIGAKSNDYNSGKDIRIKPSKRGTFTKAAKQHGMSVQGFANRVLRNPSKYSAAMRKKANFAHNAASWKH